jgi:hypothetical protein
MDQDEIARVQARLRDAEAMILTLHAMVAGLADSFSGDAVSRPASDDWMTVKQAAHLMSCDERSVRRYAKRYQHAGRQAADRQWLVSPSRILAALANEKSSLP